MTFLNVMFLVKMNLKNHITNNKIKYLTIQINSKLKYYYLFRLFKHFLEKKIENYL